MKVRSLPVIQEFPLESDPDGVAKIKIRQATFGEDAERAAVFGNTTLSWDDNERGRTTQEFKWTQAQLKQKEIWLTLCGASGFVVDDTEIELFNFKVTNGVPHIDGSDTAFYAALGRLPGPVVDEIHKRVREVNPHWQGKESGE